MKRIFTLLSLLGASAVGMSLQAQTSVKLNGSHISDGGGSVDNAFDGRRSIIYESSNESHAWVGLDLGTPQIITQVRWYNVSGTFTFNEWYADWCLGGGDHRITLAYSQLAVFEGANNEDFSDALPLYMVTDNSTNSNWHSADVNVTRGFRYVRYMGPTHSHGKVAEVEFYGYPAPAPVVPAEGETPTEPVEQFYQPTHLPVVVVHTKATYNDDGSLRRPAGTDPWEKTSESELDATFTFLSQEGTKIMTETGGFRERGNSSRNFPKRPYRVKLNNKQKPFSAVGKFKKWTLVPAIDDRSLMRNEIGYWVNDQLGQEYSPYIRPVDLFVNGEYKGVYHFCDQVEASKDGRIKMDVIKSTKDAETGEVTWPTSAYDFGWFLELDDPGYAQAEPWHFFSTNLNVPVSLKSPDEDGVPANLKNQYISTIKSHFDKMLDAANAGNVHEYLDLPSFARHFLACEFTGNTDSYRSLYLYKKPGIDKFFAGPIWDLNLAFNNDYRIGNLNQRKAWSYTGAEWANIAGIKQMMELIMDKNPAVINEVKNQWALHRLNLTAEALLEQADYWEEKLEDSQELNFTRWQNLGFKFFFQQQATGNWYDDVDYLRECLEGRMIWMDQMLGVGQKNFNLTISAGWATVYLPIAFNVPNGLTFYEVAGAQDGLLDLVEVKTTQPNRPYLVKGKNGTYSLKGSEVEVVDGQELGVLVGTAVEIPQAPVGSYVLQNHDGLVNFYKVGSTRPKIGAQRAYMVLPAGQHAPDRFYLDDETEGLYEMASDFTEPVRIYDMAGHLLREITEGQWSESEILDEFGRGMYIIRMGEDSKKVMIGQ